MPSKPLAALLAGTLALSLGVLAAAPASAAKIAVNRPSHALNPQPEVPSKPKPYKAKKHKPHRIGF